MMERLLDGSDGLKEVERAAGEFVEGTREKELSELERLLVGEERQRVVVVQGPFGIGKSCLLAQLCAKGGLLREHRASGWLRNSLLRPLSERKKGRLVVGAAYFFLLSDDDAEKSKSLSVCLYSIAHQLCSIVSGLREELEKIQDELETVDDLKTLFRKVLGTPLQRVNKMDGVVVVLDGMEALPTVERQVLLEILREHWEREMPSWISVVVSSRPARKELEAFKTIKMEYESEENKKDLEVYLKKRLEPVVVERELDLSESIKYVIRRAKGMFLYAREVTTQVVLEKEPHSLNVLDVCEIVEQAEKEGCGLDEVYRRVLQWLLEDSLGGDVNYYQVVASALAVARFPIPQGLVNELANKEVWEAFGELFQFENCVQIPHKTFAEFLLSKRRAKKTLHVVSKLGHETIVEALAADAMSPLAVRHLIFHLCQFKEWDMLREYMVNFDWLFALVSTPGAAQQVIDDLDAWYNYQAFAVSEVTTISRFLDRFHDGIISTPHLLPFYLFGRIAERDHPILKRYNASKFASTELGKKIFLPDEACLVEYEGTKDWHKKHRKEVRAEEKITCVRAGSMLVAMGSERGTTRLWDLSTMQPGQVLVGHRGAVTGLGLHDLSVISSSLDRTVRVWNSTTAACLHVLQLASSSPYICFDGVVICVFASAFGNYRNDANLGLWDIQTDTTRLIKLPRSENKRRRCVRVYVIHNGVVVAGVSDGTVHFLEIDSGKWIDYIHAHSESIRSLGADGHILVTGASPNNGVYEWKIWNLVSRSCVHVWSDSDVDVFYRCDPVVTFWGDKVCLPYGIRDLSSGKVSRRLYQNTIALCGKWVVRFKRVSQVVSLHSLDTMSWVDGDGDSDDNSELGYEPERSTMVFEGESVLEVFDSGRVSLYNTATRVLTVFAAPSQAFEESGLRTTGLLTVWGGYVAFILNAPLTARVCALSSGATLVEFRLPGLDVTAIAVCDMLLVVATENCPVFEGDVNDARTFNVFELLSGTRVSSLQHSFGEVLLMASKGEEFATLSEDRIVRVWNVKTGALTTICPVPIDSKLNNWTRMEFQFDFVFVHDYENLIFLFNRATRTSTVLYARDVATDGAVIWTLHNSCIKENGLEGEYAQTLVAKFRFGNLRSFAIKKCGTVKVLAVRGRTLSLMWTTNSSASSFRELHLCELGD